MSDRAQRIRVVIDDREDRSGLPHILRLLEDVDVSVRRLSLGDYEVDGKFLFERKTVFNSLSFRSFLGSARQGPPNCWRSSGMWKVMMAGLEDFSSVSGIVQDRGQA